MIRQQITASYDEAPDNIGGFFICSHSKVTNKSIKKILFVKSFHEKI
jgi:hypothetical protein